MDVTTDWFWEGNVVEMLARYLSSEGWLIVNKANTHSKERGVDIHASKGGATLLVEVKGYPSTNYRDPRRAEEKKPTNPTNQAQQWYSHALLKVIRLQTKHPSAKVALAFPDFPRYRALFEETRIGLETLGVAFLTVKENGDVHEWGLG
jgi:Holliday junction resolvase-like predicted endonuclease